MQSIKLVVRFKTSQELWAERHKEYVRFMYYLSVDGDICRYKLARSMLVWDAAEG